MASALSLYRLDHSGDCIDPVKLLRGLRLHLTFADLTSVVVQIGTRQQAYLMLPGCPGCAEARCMTGCRAMLLNRVIKGAYGVTARLSLVPKGLAPRSYPRRYTLAPVPDATMVEATMLRPWPEARLIIRWHRAARGAPRIRGALALGNDGPDPAPTFADRGWQLRAVQAPFDRWEWIQPLLPPRPQLWRGDMAVLTVPVAERRIAVDALPEPPTDPTAARAMAAAAALLDRVIPADTPLRPLPTPGWQELVEGHIERRPPDGVTVSPVAGAPGAAAVPAENPDSDGFGDGHPDVRSSLLMVTITEDGIPVEDAHRAAVEPAKAVLAPAAASNLPSWDGAAISEVDPSMPYEVLCEVIAQHLALIFAGLVLWGPRTATRPKDEGPGDETHEASGRAASGVSALSPAGDGGAREEEACDEPLLGEGKGAMYCRDVEEFIASMLASDAIMHGLRADRAEGPGIKRKRVAAILKPQHQHHAQRVVRWIENATLIHAAEDPTQPDKFARPLQVTDPREMLESLLAQRP